jgi:all-trans-retinol dehydrogenase (NAD+)
MSVFHNVFIYLNFSFYNLFVTLFLFLIMYIFIRFINRKIKIKYQSYLTENSVVLISGGSMGIGKEIIKILRTKYKCLVINIDIRKDLFDLYDTKLVNYFCDLSDIEGVEKVLYEIKSKYKTIDFLINNAGIAKNKKFEFLESDEFTTTYNVNFLAPMIICKKLLSHYDNIHVTNIASVMSHLIADKSCDYISSKWALYAFHESLRYDYFYNKNKKFTIICPYAVDTGMFKGFISPLPFVKILKPAYVARKIIDSIILQDKVMFVPFYMEYICFIFKLLPLFIRDFIYFKLSKII